MVVPIFFHFHVKNSLIFYGLQSNFTERFLFLPFSGTSDGCCLPGESMTMVSLVFDGSL